MIANFTKVAAIAVLGTALTCSAIPFTLSGSDATHVSGNTTSAFYEVSGSGVESGTAAGLYSSTLGGNAGTGFWVKISFDGNPQPVLTSAFLKASNQYLWWDSADLAAFNSGTFDSIILNNSGANGIKNKNGKYQGTSHAGLNGLAGTDLPDGGATMALLGLGILGFGALRRKIS